MGQKNQQVDSVGQGRVGHDMAEQGRARHENGAEKQVCRIKGQHINQVEIKPWQSKYGQSCHLWLRKNDAIFLTECLCLGRGRWLQQLQMTRTRRLCLRRRRTGPSSHTPPSSYCPPQIREYPLLTTEEEFK